MQNLTNLQTDLLEELKALKYELSLLKKKDGNSMLEIKKLKRQLQAYKDDATRPEVTYETVFEEVPIAVFRTNARTGEIIYSNKMVWKILGSDPQNGSSALDFYANPEDRADLMRDLMEHGRVADREIQVKKVDGSTFWATFSVVYHAEENVVEGVMMDISKIKESILELQKANYDLDNFVYHASHDLRAPLRSIMGLINLLRLEKTHSGKENCLEMIEGSIKRLDNLVIDLLQISKGSRSSNSRDTISFINEINNSITNFYHVEDSSDIRIIAKVHQPVEFVSDLTRIRIILNNLISNAVKYRSTRPEQSYIVVETIVDNDKAIVSISDNGQGIPESKLSSIFDMFVRATESNQGSGLGLYIVKNVVGKLGGKVSVQSEQHSGTTFRLEIPNIRQ
ncbi:MAG: hypothetical protein DHS20C17_10970 [Cyclobacteriaceae bacterium]|nr:MAG: hypothetical protein DHS20C17_10970 [Cyclobacteriaceae bacterium]